MPDAQQRVVNFFQGKPVDRPPIIPIVGRLAASISEIPPEIFLSNTTQLTTSLQKAQRLFDYDGVINYFDPVVVSEALGAEVEWDADRGAYQTVQPVSDPAMIQEPKEAPERGRLPMLIDAVERLKAESSSDAAIFGFLPGPFLTVRHLTSSEDTASDEYIQMISLALNELARAYGRADVDGLLVCEQSGASKAIGWSPAEAIERDMDILETLANIANFYDVPLTFAPRGFDDNELQVIGDHSFVDGVFLGRSNPPSSLIDTDISMGVGLPTTFSDQSPEQTTDDIVDYLNDMPDNIFVSNNWEVDPDTHPDQLHAAISGALQWNSYQNT